MVSEIETCQERMWADLEPEAQLKIWLKIWLDAKKRLQYTPRLLCA
jgi:hypothetical protein